MCRVHASQVHSNIQNRLLENICTNSKNNHYAAFVSLIVCFRLDLRQFDVKNVYLHGDLEEEISITTTGFNETATYRICRLEKALYGLKQSLNTWFDRFTKAMKKIGFWQSRRDHTLSNKHSTEGKITALLVQIDDIMATGHVEQQQLKERLATEFEIKYLGRLKYFARNQVTCSKEGIFLFKELMSQICQRKLVFQVVKQ